MSSASIRDAINALKDATPEFDNMREAINKTKAAISDANKAYTQGQVTQKQLATATTKATDNLKAYIAEQGQMGNTMTSVSNVVTAFSGVLAGLNVAVAAGIDLAYGNINELVSLYDAQIKVIRTQNLYTQALALQAAAVTVYGAGTEQATRATIAANYVGALYTQSKAQETQAQYSYATATVQNLSTMASGFLNMTNAMYVFAGAQALMTANALAESAELELAAAIPFIGAGVAIAAGGVGAYELATHLPHGGASTGGGGISATPNVNININASSNVDLPRVRQEVEAGVGKAIYQARKQKGVYA